jgi:hypothetical protein
MWIGTPDEAVMKPKSTGFGFVRLVRKFAQQRGKQAEKRENIDSTKTTVNHLNIAI